MNKAKHQPMGLKASYLSALRPVGGDGGAVVEVGEGSTIDGRYRLLRRIGSGGMADVWLAEDPHLQRRVALKILHRRFAQDREFVERFRREAEAAAGLSHPNIVAVYDRGEVEGTYYIAMQLLEGRSLKQLIDQGIAPEQSAGLIRQVLEAAGYAHRHGVVHRDLKPQNVIVGEEGKATVTDFGVALSIFFRDPDGLEGEVCLTVPGAGADDIKPPGTPAAGYVAD